MADSERPNPYARSEAKNAEVRAPLAPLAPGERPAPLLVALGLCVVLVVANVAGYLSSDDVPLGGTLVFVAVMAMAVYGLWQRRAWAVLGMLALLGIFAAFGILSLLVASNLLAVVLCLVVTAFSGTLFWKLIRVLGRIQAPASAD